MSGPGGSGRGPRPLALLGAVLGPKTVAQQFRVRLDGDKTLSVLAKVPRRVPVPPADPRQKRRPGPRPSPEQVAQLVRDLHNREVHFYRYATLNGLAAGLKVPQFYLGEYLGEDSDGLVLLEDFSAAASAAEPGLGGAPLSLAPGQVREAMLELVELQRRSGADPLLDSAFPLLDSQLHSLSNCVFYSANVFARRGLHWFGPTLLQHLLRCSQLPQLRTLLTQHRALGQGAGCCTSDLATLLAVSLAPEQRRNLEMPLLREFVQLRNENAAGGAFLGLTETELAYKESLKLAALKLLVLLVTNPEQEAADGGLGRRLQALLADVFPAERH